MKHLGRITAAIALAAAAATGTVLVSEFTAAPADTTWGAPNTADDTTWGTPPADPAPTPDPAPDGGTTITPLDTTWG